MKKIIFSSALMLTAAISFAGNPKDTKTNADPVEATAKTTDPTPLYWYPVTYDANHQDGYIPDGTEPIDYATESEVSSPCPVGFARDCIRGFEEELTEENSDLAVPSKKRSL